MRQLVSNGLPTEQHQDTSPAPAGSNAAPASSASGDSIASDEPQPIAALRQTEDRVVSDGNGGARMIPADSDDVAAARSWLASQRDAGRNPASAEVARQTSVDFNTASRLRADQSAAEMRAAIPESPEVPHLKLGDQVLADPKQAP